MESNDEYSLNSISDMLKAMLKKDKLEISSKEISQLPSVSADEIIDILLDDRRKSFDKASLTELLVSYIVSELKKDYDFRSYCMTPKVIFENNTKPNHAGSYASGNNTIVVPNNFAVWPDHIIHNITTLAHELRHFAQHNGTKEGNDFPGAISTNHNNLQLGLILNKVGDIKNVKNTSYSKHIDYKSYLESHSSEYKSFFYHDNRDYFLNPAEMDARQFSIEIGLDLIEHMNNRPNANQNLIDMYSSQMNSLINSEEEALYYTEALDNEYIDIFKKHVRAFRENIFKDEPNFFENFEQNPRHYLIYVFPALCESICVDYDDKIAHQIIKSAINAKKNNYDINMKNDITAVEHMIIESDIVLSEQEKNDLTLFFDDPELVSTLVGVQAEIKRLIKQAQEYER